VVTQNRCDTSQHYTNWIKVIALPNTPNCTRDSAAISGTTGEYNKPARSGEFYIYALAALDTPGGMWTLDVYLDTTLIRHYGNYAGASGCPLQPNGYPNYTTAVAFKAGLTINATSSSIPHGSSLSFTKSVASATCSTTVWYPDSDWVEVKILSGTELGHLQYNGVSATSFKVREAQIPNIHFLADGRQPHSAAESVKVKASVGDVTGLTSFVVACNLQPPNFKQTNQDWAGEIYDSTQDFISDQGCALTCGSIVLTAFGDSINPGQLNTWMKSRGASIERGAFNGHKMNWDVFPLRLGMQREYQSNQGFGNADSARSTSVLDNPLTNCRLVIVQVKNLKGGEHWIVVTGKQGGDYTIRDPGYSKTLLSQYQSKFWTYIIIPE